jgi:putative oxidoreductase
VPSQTITSEPKNPTARWKTIGFRVLRFVIAIFLLLAAGGKLAGVQQMVQLFDTIGLGQWFRIFTGLCELATAALLLFPATIGVGALLGFCIMVGATIANIFVLDHDFIHSSIPAIIFAVIAWTYRGQIVKLVALADRHR